MHAIYSVVEGVMDGNGYLFYALLMILWVACKGEMSEKGSLRLEL